MKQALYILIAFFVIGCQEVQPIEKPDNFIKRERMQEIIYDIAVVNGARSYNMQELSKYGVDPETYIFDKHGIDSLQFAENIAYYSADVDEYKEMYMEIQERVEGEFTYYDSIAKVEKKVRDSIRTAKARQLQKEKDSLKAIGQDTIRDVKESRKAITSLLKKEVKEIVIDSL